MLALPRGASAGNGRTRQVKSYTVALSFSHGTRVSARMEAPSPATPSITAGIMDITHAISWEPVLNQTPLDFL